MIKKSILFAVIFATAISAEAQKNDKKYIDPANMDLSVKPGDDFYEYANGKWLKTNPIPPSKTGWGSFNVLREESSTNLKGLLEDATKNLGKSRITQMTGDFYLSGMDSAAVEKAGYAPIKNELDRLEKITSLNEIISEIATLRTRGIASPLFGFYVGQDAKKVTQYIAQFGQGGTTLPDRDYYLKDDARSLKIRKEYISYMNDMFKLVGTTPQKASENATSILALETKIANAQMTRVEMRDPQRMYNKFFVDDFSKSTHAINWRNLMEKMKVTGQDSIIVSNPGFLRFADSLLTATPVATWKTYLQWYVIKNAASYLSNDFVERNFQFSKVLTGQKVNTPRWQRMSNLIDENLGEMLGQLYVEKYFKPEAKIRMIELVNNLQQTLQDRINKLPWMSAVTKAKALLKLQAFTKKIGYTDKWKTYDGVIITKNSLLDNIRNCSVWSYNERVKKLGKPIDKTEWGFTPATINASYNPPKNEITFPAGILQFPFFDFGADDAVNYGGIGAVIGHEMTHGFDDQGRQFDADGNLRDWWTEEDAKQFKTKADMVVNQFNGFTVLDTLHVNGKLTLGENIADLGGLNMAYEAFKKTQQGQSTTKIDGFTPDQRFFLSWAQVWRGNYLPETTAQLILTDPHAPGQFRTIAPLVNIDAFYKAFDVKQGDKLFKPESERIKIW